MRSTRAARNRARNLSVTWFLQQLAIMVWTVGHSTHSLDDFITMLRTHQIEAVVDVRRFPASRRLPWFNAAPLEHSLEAEGIAYRWVPSLGGRRTPHPGSLNVAWRHPSFRGYADHMQTEEFAEGLFQLLMIAGGLRTAIMCAELLWWRCHRRLIADQLTAIGVQVSHIERTASAAAPHRLTPPARIVAGSLTYEEAAGGIPSVAV